MNNLMHNEHDKYSIHNMRTMHDKPGIRNIAPLVKAQLLGAFGIGRLLNEQNPKSRRKLILAAIGLAVLALLIISYAWIIGSTFVSLGAASAVPALAIAISSLGCMFSTFAKAHGLLFGFKDFDLVVTMPVPLRAVVISRILPLYGMGLVLSLLIGTPLMAVYLIVINASIAKIICTIFVLLLAPAIPVALAIALSFLVAWAVSRVPFAHRALGIVGSLAAVAVIVIVMAFSQGAYDVDNAIVLASLGNQIKDSIEAVWLPAAWGSAAINGHAIDLLLYVGASCLAGVAVVSVLSHTLIPLNSLLSAGATRKKHRYQVPKLKRMPLLLR